MYTYDKKINWAREYDKFIAKCSMDLPPLNEYSEVHHITSRCFAENNEERKILNEPSNLIRLRFSDHIIAHLLLSFMIRQSYDLKMITPGQFKRWQQLYFTPVMMINFTIDGRRNSNRTINDVTDDIIQSCNVLKQELYEITLKNMEDLRQLARDGHLRPKNGSYLSRVLNGYVHSRSGTFKKGFKEELISLGAVEWFNSSRFKRNLSLIFDIIKRGDEKPSRHTKLGKIISNYSSKSNGIVKKKLVELGAKHWFFDSREEDTLQKILDLAYNQAARPHCTTYIGQKINQYTTPKNKCYRPGLKEELLKILSIEMGEQWFRAVRGFNNMDTLRTMVKNGEKRPICRIIGEYDKNDLYLGRVLHLYTTPGNECYREGFKEELISLGGIGWFPDERVEHNKRLILEMARNGEKRPNHRKDRMGGLLCNYTTVGSFSYQEGFKEELIKIRPDWFNDERVQNNMNLLREMARRGEKRPTQKMPLGKYLSRYLDPTSASFREGFREELMGILGDNVSLWFRT